MLSFFLRARAASTYALLGCLSASPAFTPLACFGGGTAAVAAALLFTQPPAQAQSAPAAARAAQAITVRLEGATQGSGVLVKREGNRYTVLTAWHVVSGQRPGEELAIITPDGKQHQLEQGSLQRLGQVDLAVLSFSSVASYKVAQLGEARSVAMGNPIYVAGFPLASSAVPSRLLRFLDGRVVANATVAIPNGYQLLYSGQQPTLPGMSGGPVLNGAGQLVGIHGQSETEDQRTEQEGVFVKTGTNQAVPIGFYQQYALRTTNLVATGAASKVDDYLAQAKQLLGQKGREQEVIRLADLVLRQTQSAEAYSYRGYAKYELDDNQGAIADYNQALAINPNDDDTYVNRGASRSLLGDVRGAIADYSQALAINPRNTDAYFNRGFIKAALGDKQGAVADYSQALAINPRIAEAFIKRGYVKSALGDEQGAIADYSQALSINPIDDYTYYHRGLSKSALGDVQGAIADYGQALAINPNFIEAYMKRGFAKSALGDKQGGCIDIRQAISLGYIGYITDNDWIKSEAGDWCPQNSDKLTDGIIRMGDTLMTLAQRYGITLSQLLMLNPGLENSRLIVGARIRVVLNKTSGPQFDGALAPTTDIADYVSNTNWRVESAENGRNGDYHPVFWTFHANGTVRAGNLWSGTWQAESGNAIVVTIIHHSMPPDEFKIYFHNSSNFTAYKDGKDYRYGVRR